VANLKNLGVATNPFSGTKTSIFNIGQIWSYILGVIMLFVVFAMGQRGASVLSSKVPAVDTSIEPIVKTASSAPGYPKRYL
jgi:hypothetical protein